MVLEIALESLLGDNVAVHFFIETDAPGRCPVPICGVLIFQFGKQKDLLLD